MRFVIFAKWTAHLDDYVHSLEIEAQESRIAAATTTGSHVILDQSTGAEIRRIPGFDLGSICMNLNPKMPFIAVGGYSPFLRVYNIATSELVFEAPSGSRIVNCAKWSPDGTIVGVVSGKQLSLWSCEGENIATYAPRSNLITDFGWAPNSFLLATTSGRQLEFFTPDSSDIVAKTELIGTAMRLEWCDATSSLAFGFLDRSAGMMSIQSSKIFSLNGFAQKVERLAWSYDGVYLAAAGGREISVWPSPEIDDGLNTAAVLLGHTKPISVLVSHPSTRMLASGDMDGWLMIWQPDVSTDPVISVRIQMGISSAQWSADGKTLFVGHQNGAVTAYEIWRN